MSYKTGNQEKFWTSLVEEIAQQGPRSCKGINTRGICIGSEQILKSAIQEPALGFARGFEEALVNTGIPHHFVNCSSSVAEVEGLKDPYTEVRRETDQELGKICPKGASLRIDYVLHDLPTSLGHVIQPNHAFSLLDIFELTKKVGQPIVGDPEVIAIQPIDSRQLIKVLLSSALQECDFASIPVVGPKGYTQKEVYDVYADLWRRLGGVVKREDISIPLKYAKWVAEHAPIGHIAPYSVGLLEHRAKHPEANRTHCHSRAEELAGEKLLTMEEVYASLDRLAVVKKNRLVMQAVKKVLQALANSPKARADVFKLLFSR